MSPVKEKITSPVIFFLDVIGQYIDEGLFEHAADKILLICKGFDIENSLFPYLAKKLNELPDDELNSLLEHITEAFQRSIEAIKRFKLHQQKSRMNDFSGLLELYLSQKAREYSNQGNEEQSVKCFEEARKLVLGESISKKAESQFDKYLRDLFGQMFLEEIEEINEGFELDVDNKSESDLAELYELILQAISELTPRQELFFRLYFLEGRTIREVAKIVKSEPSGIGTALDDIQKAVERILSRKQAFEEESENT